MYQNYHVLANLLPEGQQNIHETGNTQTFGSPKAVGKYIIYWESVGKKTIYPFS